MTKKRLTSVARNLRRRSTDAENRLWYYLRGRRFQGAKFLRQFPIGGFVADFACRELHVAIELDGGQHSPVIDAPRTQVIEAFGYRVIRFWNSDVNSNLNAVLEQIYVEIHGSREAEPLPLKHLRRR